MPGVSASPPPSTELTPRSWVAAVVRARWSAHAGVFALATALRVVWVLAVDRVGFAFNDALMYHTTAISVSRGDGYVPLTGGPTARWPPGFSTVLGGIYAMFGVHPVAGELFNALAGAATAVVVMLIVERTVDRGTAIVAGVMMAVLPGPILWTDVLVSETLYTLMFTSFVLLLTWAAPSVRWSVAIGVLLGLGALVRGEALTWFLLPVAMWWRTVPAGRILRSVAAAAVVCAAVMAPWTIRNAVVMDAFVPVATNASQTLWSGHNEEATGAQVYPPADYDDRFDQTLPTLELETSRALRNDALEFMITHPLRELELIPLKLLHLNRGDSFVFEWVNAPATDQAPPLSALAVDRLSVIADSAYYALLAFTLLGVVVLGRSFWRAPLGRVIATSFVTALFLYGFLYYGNYRYRLPYEPLMVIVAATVVTRAFRNREQSVASAQRVASEGRGDV